jgi:excisionase family DNA binding protein
MDTAEHFYTVDEVAAKFCVHRNTISRMIARKELGALVIGNKYRITEKNIQDYINSHTLRVDGNG